MSAPLVILCLASAAAFIVSLSLTWWLARPGSPLRALDVPNARSLHERPVPRTGGLAVLAGIVVAVAISRWRLPGEVQGALTDLTGPVAIAALGVLAVVSLVDDLRGMTVYGRLLVQMLVSAALVYVLSGQVPADQAPAWPLRVAAGLGLLWMINLYNFMDGMDGFAGGMTAIGFSTLGLIAWQTGEPGLATACAGIAAAAVGFLALNFPPARIFMGDIGAITLGALAGFMVLFFHARELLPVWLGCLLFSPFIVDATVTLLRRLARFEPVWQAHHTHYYQRLVRAGWGHRRTVLAEYVLMGAAALSTLAAVDLSATGQGALILGWAVIYAVIVKLVVLNEQAAE